MVAILKILAPGTAPFFLFVVFVGSGLVFRSGRLRRTGVLGLALLILLYLGMSFPWTARCVSAGLIQFGPLVDAYQARGVAAVVVISGDSTRARVLETLRLEQLLMPRWIVVSGEPEFEQELLQGGVPREQMLLEAAGRTTREQAVNVARLLRAHGIGRVVLVASVIHMPRALAAFRAVGVDAVSSASATRPIARRPLFWPSYDALRLSRESLYEYAALKYYRWQGWI